MAEITPKQREAAMRALKEIAGSTQLLWPIEALDALIAAGWGPVAEAEARGLRSGLDSARLFARFRYDRNLARAAATNDPSDQYLVGYVAAAKEIMEAIAEALGALADKPEEPR